MIIVLIVVAVILGIAYYLFPLIQVCGDSMYPTYLDSETIVGTRVYRKSKLKVGDVIVYESPMEKGRVVIKRIDHFMNDHGNLYIYCLGDNADYSYDSRAYGYVSSKNIMCKVINQRRNLNNVCN